MLILFFFVETSIKKYTLIDFFFTQMSIRFIDCCNKTRNSFEYKKMKRCYPSTSGIDHDLTCYCPVYVCVFVNFLLLLLGLLCITLLIIIIIHTLRFVIPEFQMIIFNYDNHNNPINMNIY